VGTFRNLSSLESSSEQFLEDEAVVPLIEFLQSKDAKNKELIKPVLETLVNISADDKIAVVITKVANGVSTIIDILSNSTLDCQGYAAVIICNIARSPDFIYTIPKRTISELLNLTKSSDEYCRTQAAAALHYLAKHDSNKLEICNSENFLNLIELLNNDDEAARNVSWTLEQLVMNANCVTIIISKCGIPKLVKYLSSPSNDVSGTIVFVIYKALRADMNLRVSIKEAGAVAPLQAISKVADKRIGQFVTYMLQVLSK